MRCVQCPGAADDLRAPLAGMVVVSGGSRKEVKEVGTDMRPFAVRPEAEGAGEEPGEGGHRDEGQKECRTSRTTS